jgi:hypothetical protein
MKKREKENEITEGENILKLGPSVLKAFLSLSIISRPFKHSSQY